MLVKRSLVRKPYYLLCFRHPFFKEAALGRPKVCNCRQTDFFKTVFSFFHIFKHPLFRAANLSKMRLSLVRGVTFRIWGRFLAPSGGGVRRALLWAKPLFYLRNLMFFLKNINFTIGFSYFLALLGLWGASGALASPPGDLLWISLLASLVLEALWGPFWMHLCPFWFAFIAFRHPMGSCFRNFKHNSWFDIEMYNQIHICVFHFVFYVTAWWPRVFIRNLTGRVSRR